MSTVFLGYDTLQDLEKIVKTAATEAPYKVELDRIASALEAIVKHLDRGIGA